MERVDSVQTADDLRRLVQGAVIQPGDAEYEEARKVWNGMIDRRPALIVRCAGVEDVAAAVNFARHHQLPLAVRGGGHHVAGHGTCDDGLVIDLSPMQEIVIDPAARTARVGGGVTWGQLDAATQAHGLATPGGVFSDTGVAGLTLGGGYGWLRRRYGLSCDNLMAAEMVTADGSVVRADAQQNSDLLWGLRGGGGNFGVVTSFEFQLHPVGPEVAFAFALHDAEGDKLMEALRFAREYARTAPDEVSSLFAIGKVVPELGLPEEMLGHPFILLGGLYAGPAAEGEKVLQPLVDYAPPLLNAGGVVPYVEAQQAFDHDYPDGNRYYWKSLNVRSLDDEVLETIIAHARRQPSPYTTIDIWPMGGAVSRMDADFSAFYARRAPYLVTAEANWIEAADDAANVTWAREFLDDLGRYSDGSSYLNFAGFQEEGDAMMQQAFGPQYARLAALKRKYDPDNLFRLNHNVKPAV